MGPRASLDGCGKIRPHRDSIPDRPARSVSLYRLSYPDPLIRSKRNIKKLWSEMMWYSTSNFTCKLDANDLYRCTVHFVV